MLNAASRFRATSRPSKAYDVSTAVYATKFASVGTQDAAPIGLAFSSDGTKMYVSGNTNDAVYQYTLSTAWDVSTAAYASKSVSTLAQSGSTYGICFSVDGTKMYTTTDAIGKVFQYNLSTAWDISTAAYATKFASVSSQDSSNVGVAFSADGTKMFVAGATNKNIYQYTLSTAWDASTATYASKSLSITTQDAAPYSITFTPDGLKLYIVGNQNDKIFQYTLSTPWDVSTGVYANKSALVSSQSSTPTGVAFNNDGSKMYVLGNDVTKVFQYNIG